MKSSIMYLFILTAVCSLDCIPLRRKRFLLQRDHVTRGSPFPTPTTFLTPTLPNWFQKPPGGSVLTARPIEPRTVLTGSSLLNSVQVQCPVKRSTDFQRILLDERLMRDLYLELVGHIDTDLMSGDLNEAETNFKHILHQSNKANSFGHTFGGNRTTFMKDIKRFNEWYDSFSDFVQPKNKTKKTSLPRKQHNVAHRLSEILEKAGISHKQLKQILQITNEIEEISQYRHRGSFRMKRSTIGPGSSRIEYCSQRGVSVGTGLLHMCSTCALTTQLPEVVFPRFVNEATCDQSDCDCFTVSGTAHGKCQPIIRNVKMLKRSEKGCRMMIQSGTQIIVDDWTLYDQPLHVGCECVFKKNSQFAQFISRS